MNNLKKQKIKNKLKGAKDKVVTFAKNNKEPLTVIGVTLLGGTIKYIFSNLKEEKRTESYWDPSTQHWWKLRRQPTNDEWLELGRRKESGEKVGDIFDDMKLLK